jgi:hypothetical protein
VVRLLVIANVVPSSPFPATMTIEAIGTSETSVLTRVMRDNIPEYGILQFCSMCTPAFSSS